MTGPQEVPVAFTVSYEGDALSEYRMPVRDLAPALLALGQAFDRSNALLNGDGAGVTLQIRATSQGSFEISLVLEQLFKQTAAFFSDEFISSAAKIKDLLIGGDGSEGLLGLTKRLKGRQPKEVSRDDKNITLEIDGLKLTIPGKVIDLLEDKAVRQQIAAVIRPVTKRGIDRVVFKKGQQTLETVEKEDVQYFKQDGNSDAITTETVIPSQRLKIASVTFGKVGKWKLSDGEKTRWYSIEDEDFLEGVTGGDRRFGSGDFLTCEILMTQSLAANGDLKLEYAITHVIDHTSSQLFQPPRADGQ